MGELIIATPGEVVQLSITLEDGATTLFPKASVINAAGATVAAISLTHIAFGMYQGNHTVLSSAQFTVVYEVFSNVGRTVLASGRSKDQDRLISNLQLIDSSILASTTRRIFVVDVSIIDQFSVFTTPPAKNAGMVQGDFTFQFWRDGIAITTPIGTTLTEITTTSGEYRFTFTPDVAGFWKVEILNNFNDQVNTFTFDVRTAVDALPGQNFCDVVTDNFGNKLPNVTVRVFESGTAVELFVTESDEFGRFRIPLVGPLAEDILIDLRFEGTGIQTFTKEGVRLA